MAKLKVNGREYTLDVEPGMPLLWALRDVLRMTGTKFGCGAGLCGACTIQIDGRPARSCITPVGSVGGRPVRTVEGLEQDGRLHPVQEAFLVALRSWPQQGIPDHPGAWITTVARRRARGAARPPAL